MVANLAAAEKKEEESDDSDDEKEHEGEKDYSFTKTLANMAVAKEKQSQKWVNTLAKLAY